MKLGVLFSGGKDSAFAAWMAKKEGHKISCLITVVSENQDSYMFHTPSIKKTKSQAQAMGIPLIVKKTKGIKELELKELENAIKLAKKKHEIEGVVTGAVESVYQSSRIQKICDQLGLECFNPLWQKDEIEHLEDIIKNKFDVIVTSVSAYPLNASWIGKKIDENFIKKTKELQKKYEIHPSGEGGEFETFVLDCPLFEKPLKVTGANISGEKNSWRMEVGVEIK
ncbi:MAG TPA: diphthine--ammonia ligase [Candidatus Pacearchaeota archaeon]|nr:diphthine--ammonia ligase [Candidatus Pacearchaeota archaeon]